MTLALALALALIYGKIVSLHDFNNKYKVAK